VASGALLAGCGSHDSDSDACPAARFCLDALFDDRVPATLGAGDPVRISGVDIGAVRSVERRARGTTMVKLAMDRLEPVYRDAVLKIRPRIFLDGDYFLDLEPGTPGMGLLPQGEPIPAAQTELP
jgi:phospholipid/cholesterol/gamma-HCH transport system substrate-binding protein